VTIRASSWGALFDCAYKWEGEHLLGMRRPSGLRASLGTAIHAGTAAFDQARIDGKPIRIDDAGEYFVDALLNPTDEVDYKSDTTITLSEAETIGLALVAKYCHEISPRFTFTSVEMKLEPYEIDCGNGITIRLTGSMDRARTAYAGQMLPGGLEVIPDIKTGARIIENGEVALKGKGAQLGAYQLMHENTTGRLTGGGQIIGLQTTKQAIVAVSRLVDGKRVMIGTENEKGLIEMAAIMLQSGFFPPNPQSQLCSEKFCARWSTCIYHD
jgi:hypothetical protein